MNGSNGEDGLAIVPVGLRVDGRRILVVGAGRIAARKAEAYVSQGAFVAVVAPDHSSEMELVDVAERIRRRFVEGDLDDTWLVVTATGLPAVDGEVYRAAESRRIWCNAADDPAHCSVILPAVARRGPFTVSVSSGGLSPAAASWLRRRIETEILTDASVSVAYVCAAVRQRVKGRGRSTETPGWQAVLGDVVAETVIANDAVDLGRRLEAAVVGERS